MLTAASASAYCFQDGDLPAGVRADKSNSGPPFFNLIVWLVNSNNHDVTVSLPGGDVTIPAMDSVDVSDEWCESAY
ncbi:MAG: hypothetical protein OHK0017_13590 [Patescibacteria group bacterium]